jgi:hypothetical protein
MRFDVRGGSAWSRDIGPGDCECLTIDLSPFRFLVVLVFNQKGLS